MIEPPSSEADPRQGRGADRVGYGFCRFTLRVPASILQHHRTKLFPSSSLPDDALSLRLAPPPSPFKTRSLLSLDKLARRRSLKGTLATLTDSPTMKRLTDRRAGGGRPVAISSLGETADEGDVFKVPDPSKKNTLDTVAEASDALAAATAHATAASANTITSAVALPPRRAPRKQENPRPLPRGDSHSRSSLNRREVNLTRRPTSTALARKKSAEGPPPAEDKDTRKRKAPTSLGLAAGTAFETHRRPIERVATVSVSGGPTLLVPDTPSKERLGAGARAFSRAASAPSFAALGRDFRPGAGAPALLPNGLAGITLSPAPALGRDEGMDWEGEEEERFVSGREQDHHYAMGTPQGKTIVSLVPDT